MILTANEAHAKSSLNKKEIDSKFHSYLIDNISKEISIAIEKGQFCAQLYYHKDNPAHKYLSDIIHELTDEYGFKVYFKKPKNENNWYELLIKW